MDSNRKQWSDNHKLLRKALRARNREVAVQLFLTLHGQVHSRKMSGQDGWSFEDEILDGLSEEQLRTTPLNEEHSIIWDIWHLSRIEDTTMNILVADGPQVISEPHWMKDLGSPVIDTANRMAPELIAELSRKVNLQALLDYRHAVGKRTREIVTKMSESVYNEKVKPERLTRVAAEGAVSEQAPRVLEYWGSLTIAGLLLMPPTRHQILHWNECRGFKKKLLKKTSV